MVEAQIEGCQWAYEHGLAVSQIPTNQGASWPEADAPSP